MGILLSYVKHPQSVVNPDGSTLGISSQTYAAKEFLVTASEVAHAASAEGLFSEITTARAVVIRFNKNVDVKFNSTSSDTISLIKDESPWSSDVLATSELYFYGAGSNVNVKVIIV